MAHELNFGLKFAFSVLVLAYFQWIVAAESPLQVLLEPLSMSSDHPMDPWNIGLADRVAHGENYLVPSIKFNRNRVRPGSSTDGHDCYRVTGVPSHLRNFINNHYQKYTHAYGIPIISSGRVSDAALKRACYVLRFLLGDKPSIRKYMYRYYGRVGIMGRNEGTTSIPEHRHLGRWWDTRARGLGGTLHIPISTGGEENLLCESGDRYRNEDIFLHEFSHGISEISIRGGAIPGWIQKLERAYRYAKSTGLWRNTYAMSTVQEYFAEGVQSYFEVNAYSATPNGIHNHVNTRAKLYKYDPTLYGLVAQVFPCGNKILDRCDAKKGMKAPAFKMNCDGTKPVVTTTQKPTRTAGPTEFPTPPPNTKPPTDCTNGNSYCDSWTSYCQTNEYVKKNCRKACKLCSGGGGCQDDQQWVNDCPKWASKGECQKNSNWMPIHCKKSCNTC